MALANNTSTTENVSNLVHIKVTSQNNEEIIFKVKNTTAFEKLMDKYCERFNISNQSGVRFLFDGEAVKKNQTPSDLGLEDGDVLECVIEQVGGTWLKEW